MAFRIDADVPPQDGSGEPFQVTLKIEANGTALGAADVETLNFADGLVATRGLSGDPNRVDVSATGGGGGDAESIPGLVTDGTTNNLTAISAALGPTGSYVVGAKPRAKFATTGNIRVNGIFDIHPSISFPNDARGVNVLSPGNNLPATTSAIAGDIPPSGVGDGSGADAAFVRIVRDSPSVDANNLAYSYIYRGFNIDATGTTQINPVHGVRIPNADPTKNSHDPDPNFSGNKDYVAGSWADMDIVGFPGSGFVAESTNGRLHLHSVRALNNGHMGAAGKNHGFDLNGNDIVVDGHSAAGGNYGSSFKVGNASGFFAVTTNVWGSPTNRSLTCQAAWINARKLFGWGFSEFNDWVRLDGNLSYWRGGVFALNSMAPFNDNFIAEGIANDQTSGGPDPRLQAHFGVVDYQSFNLVCNQYQRTESTNVAGQPGGSFGSWMNVGGLMDGTYGTAHQKFVDVSNNAMVNTIDTVCSAPNVRPWTGRQAAFTVTLASPGVFTSAAHGLNVGDRLALTTTGALPTGLTAGISFFVVVTTTDTFQLARIPGGAAINTSGSQSGVHTWGVLDTLPYDTHGGAQLNYLLMDAFKNEFRVGAMGRTHSHLMLGANNADFGAETGLTGTFTVSGSVATAAAHGMRDGFPVTLTTTGTLPAGVTASAQYWAINTTTNTFQLSALPGGNPVAVTNAGTGTHTFWSWYRHYAIEAGDRIAVAAAESRNALYGAWELDGAVRYQDSAYDARITADGGTRTVRAGLVYQLLSTAGGGISTYNIVLPTGMPASYELVLNFVGGTIGAISYTTAPTASAINLNAFALPAGSPGTLMLRLLYRRDSNQWYVTQVSGGDYAAPVGRVDGASAPNGIVGEIQKNTTLVGSAVALTTATPANIVSLTLQPGNWLVWGYAGFTGVAVVPTGVQYAVSTVSATLPGVKDNAYGTQQLNLAATSTIFGTYSTGPTYLKLTVPTTIYLVEQAAFTGTSCGGYGQIVAQRVQ